MSSIDNKIKEFAKSVSKVPSNLEEFNIGNSRSSVNTYKESDNNTDINEAIDNTMVLPNSLIVTTEGDTYYTNDGIIAYSISPAEAENALKNKTVYTYSQKVEYLDIYKSVTSYDDYKKIVQ